MDILLPSDLHMTLTYNEHEIYYHTIEEEMEGWGNFDDWISDKEKERAIKNNSWWRIQWYPNTPVGFYSASGSSLEAVCKAVNDQGKEK